MLNHSRSPAALQNSAAVLTRSVSWLHTNMPLACSVQGLTYPLLGSYEKKSCNPASAAGWALCMPKRMNSDFLQRLHVCSWLVELPALKATTGCSSCGSCQHVNKCLHQLSMCGCNLLEAYRLQQLARHRSHLTASQVPKHIGLPYLCTCIKQAGAGVTTDACLDADTNLWQEHRHTYHCQRSTPRPENTTPENTVQGRCSLLAAAVTTGQCDDVALPQIKHLLLLPRQVSKQGLATALRPWLDRVGPGNTF